MDHILWEPGGPLRLLDQRKLPWHEVYVTCEDHRDVAAAIRDMVVRGAPAIGATAAFGMALASIQYVRTNKERAERDDFASYLEDAAHLLKSARPTAVNLSWAVDRMLNRASRIKCVFLKDISLQLQGEAEQIFSEDIQANMDIGIHGARILPSRARVLTYCNAGSLATAGYGTALGVIRAGWEAAKVRRVYVCETRPYLQGGRLTAYELCRDGIPVTLITDNTAGYIFANNMIDIVIVGADRITRKGHTANKIGTYILAVLAKEHGIPFYIAAPLSTFDLGIGDPREIPIEMREGTEVTRLNGIAISCEDAEVLHPAFDITPAALITGIITEKGVITCPEEGKIRELFRKEGNACY